MTLIGLLWAIAAPLLLLMPVALLAWLLGRWRPAWPRRRRWGLAAAATAALVALSWLPQRLQFAALCDGLGPPRIEARAAVAGFFLDDGTANSFGMRYLHDEGFDWIEARSIYRRDAYTRYRKVDGRIEQQEIDHLTAAHVFTSTHERLPGGVQVHRQFIRERASGRLMAQAASANFDGGTAKWVLGAWGSASCPNPVTTAGSAAFQATYHLARDTLGRRP
jgi:hypothetical protein